MKKKKWYEITYFNCDCFSAEHLLRFFKNNDEDELSIEMELALEDNVFKRTYDALAFLFYCNVKRPYIFILHRDEVKEFRKFIKPYCKNKIKKDFDRFEFADNGENVLEFTFNKELRFLEASVAFSECGLRDRIKKSWRHFTGVACKYGNWDIWKTDEKNLSKLLYLTEKLIKLEKELGKEK